MVFSEFAQVIADSTRDNKSEAAFVEMLFENITSDDAFVDGLPYPRSPEAYRSYYNGYRGISTIARRILPNLDQNKFADWIGSFSSDTQARLQKELAPFLPTSDPNRFPEACAALYSDIIMEASHHHPGPKKRDAVEDRVDVEEGLGIILRKLGEIPSDNPPAMTHMNAVRIKKKATECSPTFIKDIELKVKWYCRFIQEQLGLLEDEGVLVASQVHSQVRYCYQSLKSVGIPQEESFYRVRDWLMRGTGCTESLYADILTAYFVQTCEVFDAPAK